MAKKAATFPDAILVNKVMSASAPAFVRLAGGKGGGTLWPIANTLPDINSPFNIDTWIPGQTAYHVVLIKRSQIIYHPTFVPELTSASPENVTVGSMKIISQQQQTLRRWRNNWNENFLTIVRLVPFLHRPFLTYLIADGRYSSTALDAYKMALHSRFIMACSSPHQRWSS